MGTWSKWTVPASAAIVFLLMVVLTTLLTGCEIHLTEIMEGFKK